MRITRATHYAVNVPETRWWWSDDVYGQPAHRRADRGVVEVETDEGLTGLAEVNRGAAPEAIVESLRSWVGVDVLAHNLHEPFSQLPGSFEQAVYDLRGRPWECPSSGRQPQIARLWRGRGK